MGQLWRGTPWPGPCLKLAAYGVREVVSSISDQGNIVGWVFHPDQVAGKGFSSEHAFPSKFWIYLEHSLSSWGGSNERYDKLWYSPDGATAIRVILLMHCTWTDLAFPTLSLAGVNCAKHWEESIWQWISRTRRRSGRHWQPKQKQTWDAVLRTQMQ